MMEMLVLHTLDGEISINPKSVTSIREAKDTLDNKAFTSGVHCMVNLTDGKFVTVVETCAEVREKLRAKAP